MLYSGTIAIKIKEPLKAQNGEPFIGEKGRSFKNCVRNRVDNAINADTKLSGNLKHLIGNREDSVYSDCIDKYIAYRISHHYHGKSVTETAVKQSFEELIPFVAASAGIGKNINNAVLPIMQSLVNVLDNAIDAEVALSEKFREKGFREANVSI